MHVFQSNRFGGVLIIILIRKKVCMYSPGEKNKKNIPKAHALKSSSHLCPIVLKISYGPIVKLYYYSIIVVVMICLVRNLSYKSSPILHDIFLLLCWEKNLFCECKSMVLPVSLYQLIPRVHVFCMVQNQNYLTDFH